MKIRVTHLKREKCVSVADSRASMSVTVTSGSAAEDELARNLLNAASELVNDQDLEDRVGDLIREMISGPERDESDEYEADMRRDQMIDDRLTGGA